MNKVGRPKGSKDLMPRQTRTAKKAKELVGQKINRWSVLNYLQGNSRIIKLHLKCDCGKEKIINYVPIHHMSISCGCYQKEVTSNRQIKPDNYSAKKKVYNGYKYGAIKRNLCFNLTEPQVFNLIFKNCYYCNQEPFTKRKSNSGFIVYNGIDRVDNTKGYEIENCVTCCQDCNYKKGYVTKEIAKKIVDFVYKK